MISFVIPARNERALIGATIDALHVAARACGVEHEIVVADDASTDDTADIARRHGARVVSVDVRQIAAARNAGARAARGSTLVFVDADTLVPTKTLAAALAALEGGAVGGGARIDVEEDAPPHVRRAVRAGSLVLALCRWAAGCFVFARRDAFEAVGGFDERYYASEEIHLSRALKKQGRFVIVREACVTSSRKLRLFGVAAHIRQFLAVVLLAPLGILRRRDRLFLWYDIRRDDPARPAAAEDAAD